jgi:hypothetical protein
MSIRWYLLFVATILVGGCQSESGALVGSSTGGISGNILSSSVGIEQSVSLKEMVDDPEAFMGDQLRLSGNLSRAPLSQCSLKSRTHPANWILSDGDNEISIAYRYPETAQLSRELSGVVVHGHWLHWEGMVGCGQDVQMEEQWYLSVERLESPNPVAFVPMVSESEEEPEDVPDQGPELIGPEEQATVTLTPFVFTEGDDEITDLNTPSPQAANVTQTPIMAATPSATMTIFSSTPPTPTLEDGQPPPLSTSTPTQEVPALPTTATPTMLAASPTVSIDLTPLASATVNAQSTIFRMDLPVSSIETGNLGQNEIHRWTHEITSTKQLTVNLASDHQLDIVVTIVDPAGQILVLQNNSHGQEPEIVEGITLIEPGVYDILISSPTGEPGFYAILISDDESYPFLFKGTLLIDDVRSIIMVSETDHFWHFTGNSGQSISLSVVPFDDSDLFLNLFGTDGISLIRFHDETTSGEPEQLINYILPDTGIYSLRVGEYNLGQAEYEIFLTDG